MKTLLISSAESPDYQCDMVFHGLRSMIGADVVDVSRLWYLYADDFKDGREKSTLYGRGFTLYGLLTDDQNVDRDDILIKISCKFYDVIVIGSVWRTAHVEELVSAALRHYPRNRIVFIDGEDHTDIRADLIGRGLYFKRELAAWVPGVLPINFAIPAVNILKEMPLKTRDLAFIDPRRRDTYIYDSQEDYYADYRTSLFGMTTKKGGWDCLRHYEIIANWCIPHFLALRDCPTSTMVRLPKYQLLKIADRIEAVGVSSFHGASEEWQDEIRFLHRTLRASCTTVALGRYIFDNVLRAAY